MDRGLSYRQTSDVSLGNCRSDIVVSNTGAPQGTVLSLVLFSLYTSNFQYNTESCHVQKFVDDTAIVGCNRHGQDEEYRNLIKDFVKWCNSNHLNLNTSKTEELVVDFRRPRPLLDPVIIRGDCVQRVQTYKYLGVQLDDKLDWTANTDACAREDRADYTSLEDWRPSTSAIRCCRCSIRRLW
ncbi:RTJK polymerase, partial [Polypterus senegalus]